MKKKIVSMMLVLCALLLCAACGKQTGGAPGALGTANADTSEAAMDRFAEKLRKGNYVVESAGRFDTVVFSPEQVRFVYEPDSGLDDYVFMTLKGETFCGVLAEDGVTDVTFKGPVNAIDALPDILPNGWIALTEGNLFELFYNDPEDPLEFTSHDPNVGTTLLRLAGYGDAALSFMEDVHMHFDAPDPTAVTFSAQFGSAGMIHYDDLALTLRFGTATGDPRVEKWLKKPVYPPTRTGWTEMDVAALEAVFLRGYGEESVPFPSFASYALLFDENAYAERSEILITDAHGTEKDLAAYEAVLLDTGYQTVDVPQADGGSVTAYRKLLRPDYSAYAELYPSFDNGFSLRGRMYYDEPVYDGLDAINGVLRENGFAQFPATDVLSGWKATDSAKGRSEGWLYFFDYDLYMPFLLTYQDLDAARAYLKAYGDSLAADGFLASDMSWTDGGEYESFNGFTIFRYTFNDDDTVTLTFKKEKSLTPEEVRALLRAHELPEADIHGDIGARDLTRYYYNISGFSGLKLSVYQPFGSTEEAERFLDEYVAAADALGYLPMDPQKLGSQREFLFFNEELKKYFAFDLFPGEDEANITLEFVSIEPDEASYLESVLRR